MVTMTARDDGSGDGMILMFEYNGNTFEHAVTIWGPDGQLIPWQQVLDAADTAYVVEFLERIIRGEMPSDQDWVTYGSISFLVGELFDQWRKA